MAIKPLKSIKFPELPDTYTIPQVDSVPTQGSSNAVSSGGVYESINEISGDINDLKSDLTTEATLRAYGKADVNISWVTGGISGTGANNDNYTMRIRTNDYYDFGDGEIVANSNISSLTFQLIFYKYNKSDRSFIDSTKYSIATFPATIQTDGDYLYRLSWLDSRGTEQASATQIELKTESQIEYVPDVIATEISDTAKSYAVPVVNPEEYCFVCNHHDNFSREETGWEMGQNSGSSYDVNNYEYVTNPSYDDGFRVNNGLTCSRNTSRTNAFSIRKLKASHAKDFMVEFSCPIYPNYNGIAWDIEDINNFTTLQIGRESSYILLDCYTVKKGARSTQIFRKNVYNTNPEIVQVYFVNGVASVYFDDQIIASFAVTPFTSKVGIIAYRSLNLVMSFINMFDLSNHVVFNPNYILDRGISTVPTTTLSTNANRYSLSDAPARWSNYAEHFTLESTDEMIYHGIRTERATESLVDTNLRTVHYEFDVMFPSGYGFDTPEVNYHDSIFQFHDRESDLSARGDVCFYLAVIGDKLTVYMSSTHEALSENVVTQANFEPILTITEDKWYHVEIYQRERYDENQHPFTQIKIDDVIVWESRKPNAYNDRRGSGLQYGIYKNNWHLMTSMGRFFDNVKVVF